MIEMNDVLVDEFFATHDHESELISKSALIKAYNTLPEKNDKNLLFKFAARNLNFKVRKHKEKIEEDERKERIRKEQELEEINLIKMQKVTSNKGKLVQGGTTKCPKSFWEEIENAEEKARDDDYLPDCQPEGKYKLVKDFLKNDWGNVKKFKLPKLQAKLVEKYPEEVNKSGEFKMQRWGNAYYFVNSGEVAIKPLWKKLDNRVYLNIFYKS